MTNSFAVPYQEGGREASPPHGLAASSCLAVQARFDIQHHNTLCKLHKMVNPTEVVVGWYGTGTGCLDTSFDVHDFYCQVCSQPVHFLLDVRMASGHMKHRAYIRYTESMYQIIHNRFPAPEPTTGTAAATALPPKYSSPSRA